jgi:hypothetical protein
MNLKDFKIGEYFYTGAGKWLCVDVATKSVLAFKAAALEIRGVSIAEALNTKYWFSVEDPIVFYDDDFGGCDVVDRFSK